MEAKVLIVALCILVLASINMLSDTAQVLPDYKTIVREIVDREGW